MGEFSSPTCWESMVAPPFWPWPTWKIWAEKPMDFWGMFQWIGKKGKSKPETIDFPTKYGVFL
jgi:hypothetical protein